MSVSLYWNYVGWYYGSSAYWLESVAGSLPLVLDLWMLCWSCELAQSEAQAIGHFVHRLRTGAEVPGRVIRAFSLQLRQLPFRFSGRGFVIINFDLIKDVSWFFCIHFAYTKNFFSIENWLQ